MTLGDTGQVIPIASGRSGNAERVKIKNPFIDDVWKSGSWIDAEMARMKRDEPEEYARIEAEIVADKAAQKEADRVRLRAAVANAQKLRQPQKAPMYVPPKSGPASPGWRNSTP